MRTRLLTDEPLRVLPELLGRELAGPWRRGIAFALDYIVLLLPTVVLALTAAAFFLHLRDPGGFRALRTLLTEEAEGTPAQHEALRQLAPLLVHIDAPGLPREVQDAVEAGDLDRAATALEATNLVIAFALGQHEEKLAPNTVRIALERLIPKTLQGVCLFGLAALYFTLLHTGRHGATLGKRVMGIQVVRLDGHRLSIPEGFERFVGYLHIPGSLGLSLLDLWRDPNRRQPHDRIVHTAVLRVLRPEPSAPSAAETALTIPPSEEPHQEA
jgi:uncharacterized RDD family membrane protein YckC